MVEVVCAYESVYIPLTRNVSYSAVCPFGMRSWSLGPDREDFSQHSFDAIPETKNRVQINHFNHILSIILQKIRHNVKVYRI